MFCQLNLRGTNQMKLNIYQCNKLPHGTQRAKFSKNVHKPPHWVNVINFELDGLDASIWVPWKHSDPKKS